MARASKAAGSPGKCASCGKGLPKGIKSAMTKCPHCGKALKTDSSAIEDAALTPVALAARRLQEAVDARDGASTNAELVVARAGASVRADQLVAALRDEAGLLWEAGFLEKLHPRDRLGKWMEKLEPGTMVRVKPPGPGGPARPVTFKGRSGENVHVEGLGQGFRRGQTYTLPAHRLMEPGGGDHKSHQVLGKGVGSLGMFKGSGAVLSRVEGEPPKDWTKQAISKLGVGKKPASQRTWLEDTTRGTRFATEKPPGDVSSGLVAWLDDLHADAEKAKKRKRTFLTPTVQEQPRRRMLREQQVRLLVGSGTVENADEAHILLDRIGA